jgi:hypothetical protein
VGSLREFLSRLISNRLGRVSVVTATQQEELAGISDPQLFLVWLQDRHGENALAYRYFTHFLGIKGAGHGQILADAESPEPGACE